MLRIFISLLFVPIFFSAQNYPSGPTNYVTDQANILNESEEAELNSLLKVYEDSTSIQLFVYTAPSLNGAVMADLCQEIFHNWKIGNKKTNNGVLIGVFVSDHKFRIHTGYGMEGVLPDILTKRIQDEHMRPFFKQENYYGGINAGIEQIIYYSNHEYKPEEVKEESYWISFVYGYMFNIPILCLFLYLLLRKKQHKTRSQATKTTLIIVAIILALFPCIGSIIIAFMLMIFIKPTGGSSSGGSTWYSSSSDSSSSYDSGSSFDGGGGGDSGGGGSDSSW